MGVHWQVKFKSLRTASDYVVNIYDADFSGTPVQLTGADRPFEVAEDDSDDMFIPVRTQSGYIRVVDDGSVDWSEVLPTSAVSRPVTVVKGNAVVWQGFIQPRTFSGELFGNPQVREFPVCCALSILSTYDIAPDHAETADFGNVIGYILEFIPSLDIDAIYIAGGAVDEWLEKLVDWARFRTYKDEEEVPVYNAKELLEEVCKFWGWTCRTIGQEVYFTLADTDLDPAFMGFRLQDLTTNNRQPWTQAWQTKALSGDIYASANNTEEIMMGIKRATLDADTGKFDALLELDLDIYERWLDNHNVGTVHTAYGTDGHLFSRRSAIVDSKETGQGVRTQYWDFGNCTLEIDISTPQGSSWTQNGKLFEYYNFQGDLYDLHDIPFTPALMIYRPDQGWALPLARIKSKHSMNFDHGAICLCGSTFYYEIANNTFEIYNGACQMLCRLQVGDLYWDGQDWTSTRSTFIMANVGGTSFTTGEGRIVSNRYIDPSTWTSPYPNYNGFGIPVSGNIAGIVTFEILELYTVGNAGVTYQKAWMAFKDFEIRFVRALAYAPQNESAKSEYKSVDTNAFPDERSISTIFASDNGNAAGSGIIMNTNKSYCSTVTYEETGGMFYDHPEQFLVDRIATYGQSTKRKLIIEVLDDKVQGVTPGHRVTLDGSTFYPVSLSHKFRDDITTIILLEI